MLRIFLDISETYKKDDGKQKKLQRKACNFIKKDNLAQLFSCEFCEISKNTFFYKKRLDNCLWRTKLQLWPEYSTVSVTRIFYSGK